MTFHSDKSEAVEANKEIKRTEKKEEGRKETTNK
jgi:hypothetical protein